MTYQSLTSRFWMLTLGAFVLNTIAPSDALAFEAKMISVKVTSHVRFVRSEIQPFTPPTHQPVTVTQQKTAPKIAAKIASQAILIMEGPASYYSRAGCLGCNSLFIMANGQPLNDNALTMAIGADKVHLVGRNARVTSLATGKSVQVRITDTGGFYKEKYGHRVADLTPATKQAIGMKGGLGQVRVEVF